jgi:hypothetical protein
VALTDLYRFPGAAWGNQNASFATSRGIAVVRVSSNLLNTLHQDGAIAMLRVGERSKEMHEVTSQEKLR